MEIAVVCPVLHFEFDSERLFELERFVVSKNEHYLTNQFFNEKNMHDIGRIEVDRLLTNYFFHFKGDSDSISQIRGNTNPFHMVGQLHGLLSNQLGHLWFIKDNSVTTFECLLFDYGSGYTCKDVRSFLNSNASGEYSVTTFSQQEWQQFIEIIEKVRKFREVNQSELEDLPAFDQNNPTKIANINYLAYNSSINRISRALRFLDYARFNSFLPQKISFYIAILESLFTTDNIEVVHKVTERSTLYLGGEKGVKEDNFDLIKAAYNIRSKYVHGQTLKKGSKSELSKVSVAMDSLVRQLLLKVINIDAETFLLNDDNLNKWFKDLILR